MHEQFDSDLDISGVESESRNYEAINNIEINSYYSTQQFDINFKAGREVDFQIGTDLDVGMDKCISASIELAEFECAIPFAPLTVNLISPAFSLCNSLGTSCNAEVFGGKPPYSFVWQARNQNESDFTVFSQNIPNMLFLFEEGFFVKVEVFDDRGTSVMSDENFVSCLWQRIGSGTDTIIDNSTQNNFEYSNIASKFKNNYFKVYPNPTTSNITISAFLSQNSNLTIHLYDVMGKLVFDFENNKHYAAGTYEFTYDVSDFNNGIYFISVISEIGTFTFKLVKSL